MGLIVKSVLVAHDGSQISMSTTKGMSKLLISRISRIFIGIVSNSDNKNIKLGKAGRKRYLGFRPKVRGVVMNPVDHPHGGGEGRSSGGRHPVTPWGKSTKGKKTRNNKKTNMFILKRRKK